jgi:hypothetical protein
MRVLPGRKHHPASMTADLPWGAPLIIGHQPKFVLDYVAYDG